MLLCLLVGTGCGDDPVLTAGAGGATGQTGDAGSSTSSGGTGGSTAGPVGGSASGGANSSAGESSGGMSNAGGSASGAIHCGGDLVGAWTGEVPRRPKVTPQLEVNSCWDLMFFGESDGMLSISSRLSSDSPDVKRYVTPTFEMAEMAGDANPFTLMDEEKGPVVQHFAPECMMFEARQVMCEELTEPLGQLGLGEGSWRNTVCTAAADGGCDCAMDYWAVGGPVGTWKMVGERLVLSTERYNVDLGDYETVTTDPIDYCVMEDTVRFDVAINEVWVNVSGAPLARVDCTDGSQGPGEQGVDCGYPCQLQCPVLP